MRVWIGVLGAPAAWAVQHVTGYALTEATCDEAGTSGWDVHMDLWTIVVTAAAAAVALAAMATAIATFRATREAESEGEPPRARIHFLAVIGITIGPLFLAMILMSGLGAVFLTECVQS
jgi:Mn2+/Fe2+ NRAMP family transporter